MLWAPTPGPPEPGQHVPTRSCLLIWGGRGSLTASGSAAAHGDDGNIIPGGHHLPVCWHQPHSRAHATAKVISALTCTKQGDSFHFYKYSRSVQAIRHPGTSRIQPRCQPLTSTMQLQLSHSTPEATQGQGHKTHHAGLTGSPLHLLLICHAKLSCDGRW